jgi:hypothetical protein
VLTSRFIALKQLTGYGKRSRETVRRSDTAMAANNR